MSAGGGAAGVDTLEFLDEVVQVRAQPAEPAKPDRGPSRGRSAPAADSPRAGGVLQFSKRENREGLFHDDLDQVGGMKKWGMVVVALAAAGAMGYLAWVMARG